MLVPPSPPAKTFSNGLKTLNHAFDLSVFRLLGVRQPFGLPSLSRLPMLLKASARTPRLLVITLLWSTPIE